MAAASSSSQFFGTRPDDMSRSLNMTQQQQQSSSTPPAAPPPKKRRNQPGTPYPDAEVIALSPKTLMATNRFICEVCNKGFQREQNLQLHRRGHNLPWKLKQKSNKEVRRKVYLCPEPTCVHHEASRALGDLTGIKKHYSRKHGEKKWKCDKCSKRYAVQSDWKAHSKTCGTREYRCDCGTLFSRRDSFITHRAFCDALVQESARQPSSIGAHQLYGNSHIFDHSAANMLRLGAKFEHPPQSSVPFFMPDPNFQQLFPNNNNGLMQLPDLQGGTVAANSISSAVANSSTLFNNNNQLGFFSGNGNGSNPSSLSNSMDNNPSGAGSGFLFSPDHHHHNFSNGGSAGQGTTTLFSGEMGDHGLSSIYDQNMSSAPAHMSATALLQKAAQMGSTTSTNSTSSLLRAGQLGSSSSNAKSDNIGANFNGDSNNNNNLQGLFNSLAAANDNSSLFGAARSSIFGGDINNGNLQQNMGSDKLTLDFLGVGGMVRNIGAHKEGMNMNMNMNMNMSSLNHHEMIKSGQTNLPFGTANNKLL